MLTVIMLRPVEIFLNEVLPFFLFIDSERYVYHGIRADVIFKIGQNEANYM